MGLFDRFFKPRQTAPAVELPPAPRVPAKARILSFELADEVGLLELESGEKLPFGRTACEDFVPVVGASVLLEEVSERLGAWRASRVTLDSADPSYDGLLSARDERLGLPARVEGVAAAAAAARSLASVTVLLRTPLPEGNLALKAWARERGLPEGFALRTERDLSFLVEGTEFLTYAGRGAFPTEGLDTTDVPEDFDFGCAFIGLGIGLPGVHRQERLIVGNAWDVWAPKGEARKLSMLTQWLLEHGSGVVLHRAGNLVVPAEQFVRMLGELDDDECRPFSAWLAVGPFTHEGTTFYGTFGMDVFGLPDVAVSVKADDPWSRQRRHEAVLFAAYRMIRENRELRAGEHLHVPLRLRVGAWPLDISWESDVISYEVSDDGEQLVLVPEEEQHPELAWREPDARLALNAYQALFDRGLDTLLPSELRVDVRSNNPDVTPHSVEVRERHDGQGFLLVTNGFGRLAQGDAGCVDCPRVEIGAWLPDHSFELLRFVGGVASGVHESTVGWKPCDTVATPNHERGMGGFVLADGGQVEMGGGPGVRLLLLVPLSPPDYERVRGGGAAEWLSRNTVGPSLWAPFL
ncbi:hypothetical protein [Myxococcus eversor]|uniref:hypothetical protein n=1 Tax=Myxococcus eversor TaxID=2709661 RepID=UPI0013D0D755|nr:hypothetical protein [Myxococcus eversor]